MTFLKKYFPVPGIVSGLFIFVLCLLPAGAFPDAGWAAAFLPDKWVHFILYALWIRIHSAGMKNPNGSKVFATAIFMFFYGGLIELFQEYFTDRSGEWLDWVADGVGLFTGFLYVRIMGKKSVGF